MRYEEQLEKLKAENSVLSETTSNHMQSMLRMEEQVQTLELELMISQEKHRTCQHEVSALVTICRRRVDFHGTMSRQSQYGWRSNSGSGVGRNTRIM